MYVYMYIYIYKIPKRNPTLPIKAPTSTSKLEVLESYSEAPKP